jgi:hypothetical protein
MPNQVTDIPQTASADAIRTPGEPPFGANEMRLSAREWLVTLFIVVTAMLAIPRLWKSYERWTTGPDYRIPYSLSNDYWLFQRRLEQIAPSKIPIIGDSVIWGEYVRAYGTLSHFLNQKAGVSDAFVNCGMNGLYPLALEGLLRHYGSPLRGGRIIVHCNVLWMSNPKADLSSTLAADQKDPINHSRLLPQFYPWIPRYSADGNERLSAAIEPHVEYFQWVTHLQNAYYDQRSIPKWTLEEDFSMPPVLPNAWRNPLAPLATGVPGEPADDPERGRESPRHKPWSGTPSHFDWVGLDASLQWKAFGRLIELLRSRGNSVLVVVGPFNEHMIAEDQRPGYRLMRAAIVAKLAQDGVAVIAPPTLPSELYADASHPLTEGYERLAKDLYANAVFQNWVGQK